MGDNPGSDLIAAPGALPACAQVAPVVHQFCTASTVAHFVHMSSRVSRTGLSTVVQLLADRAHLTLESNILTHQLGDLFDRVERRGVVAATKGTADDR